MKSNRYMRGPSAIEPAGGQEEERTVRAAASKEKEDQREVKSDTGVSERAVQKSCSCSSGEGTKAIKPKARRVTNLYKTICDLDIAKKDKTNPLRFYPGSSAWLSVVGTGTPKVIPLNPSLIAKMGPCELEVYAKHEDVHVQNAKANCAAFKTCVEGYYSWYSSTIYYNDFAGCHNTHHGGLDPDCKKDEMQAYAASAALASKLSKESRCSKEQSRLQSVATQHTSWAATPPNCKSKP
ncbi:MAG: hypothetical protein P8P74_18185 [Crocinitomicaceae bacterium]|nr:hypothetical protein [Crocinitomicaceae bacterium]